MDATKKVKISNQMINLINKINLYDAITYRKYNEWSNLAELVAQQIHIDLCTAFGDKTKHSTDEFHRYENVLQFYLCVEMDSNVKNATYIDFFYDVKKSFVRKGYMLSNLTHLSDGSEITTETVLNDELAQNEIAKFYGWDLDFIYGIEGYEEFFWEFAACNNFAADSLEKFHNYKYVNGKPLMGTHHGGELRNWIIINHRNVQWELLHYYGWVDKYVEYDFFYEEAFWCYCINLHYANLTPETIYSFEKAYKGFYEDIADYIIGYCLSSEESVKKLPEEVYNNINWEAVAEAYQSNGKFYYYDTMAHVHVFVD